MLSHRTGLTLLITAHAFMPLLYACSSSKDCTLMGCEQGVAVHVSPIASGTYDIDVTIDATTTHCTSEVLGTGATQSTCTHADGTSVAGATRPDDVYVLGAGNGVLELRIASTSAQSVSVHIVKSGVVVASTTFQPMYEIKPGPNGPDCEPNECHFASTNVTAQ